MKRPIVWELGKEVKLFNGSLKKLRKERGLYQKDVAKKVGISIGTYSHIENMRLVPRQEIADKIADFFGKDVRELFPMEFLKFMHTQNTTDISYGKMEIKALETYEAKEALKLEESCDPEQQTLSAELASLLTRKIDTMLKPREKKIVKMKFGLDGYNPHTLAEIADVFMVTRDRVRQILERALSKLKKDTELQKYRCSYFGIDEKK